MKKMVNLSVCGRQYYPGQDPEVIELTTEGTMQWIDNGWEISYEESELTGLVGTTTTFRLEDGQVVLIRNGQVRSQMIFREGVPHDSLYQLDFGALLITVCAKQIQAQITEAGGTIDLVYSISIEQGEEGLVEYHLEIRAK